ncbi:hypothetical protein HDU80_010042 [Chytriomyces hyalinus]|nr:hypothetical protein HDU80_010042 [Chytriomyces hyalinus]
MDDAWEAISLAVNADPPAHAGPRIDIMAIKRLAQEAESPREVLLFATQMLSSLAQTIDAAENESASEDVAGLESDTDTAAMRETQHEPIKQGSDMLAVAAKAAALIHVVTVVLKRISSKKYSALLEPVHGALIPVYPLLSAIASLKLSVDIRARAITDLASAFSEIVSSISTQKRANLEIDEMKKLDSVHLYMCDCVCASITVMSAASDLEPTIQNIYYSFNETLAKQFDFLKLAHGAKQRSTPSCTIAFPFVAQKWLHHQNICAPETVTEWIPRVITTSALFREILPTLVALLESAPSNPLHMTCSLSILEHLAKVKKSIQLRSLDSSSQSNPTDEFFTALLGAIAQTPNPAQRTPLVGSFKLLFNELPDRQSKLEVVENKMLTSKHENMRAFGVYTYKNWIMEAHEKGLSGDHVPRAAGLCFALDSAVYSVSSRALPFMHDDDAFFQVLPIIAQAVNFLSYLKRYSLYNNLDQDGSMKRIQTNFVDPLCHRVDVMMQARKRAMEMLKAGQSQQCEV